MKRIEMIVATSHVDMHNEVISRAALERMAERMNQQYIPIGIEHDHRKPPVGRVISARVVKLEDGEYGVEGIGEIFEPGDFYPLSNDDKEIPITDHQTRDKLQIVFDRNYENEDDQEIIKEISELLESEPQEEIKKAVEPLTVLTIVGAFVLGGIANGFLGKIGSDAYDRVKSGISKLVGRRQSDQDRERLLVFMFVVEEGDTSLAIEVILTNPTEEHVDKFLKTGLHELDTLVSQYYDPKVGLRRITAEFTDGNLKLTYGIRKDAIPLFPTNGPKAKWQWQCQHGQAADLDNLECSLESPKFTKWLKES